MLQEIMPFVSRHPILSPAWIALLVAVIVMTFKSRFSKVKEIARGEAIRLINKEEAVVVDTRSRDDFRRGHRQRHQPDRQRNQKRQPGELKNTKRSRSSSCAPTAPPPASRRRT